MPYLNRFCAATIAIEHVPRRKAEVVTEVTDRLIKVLVHEALSY